MRAQRFYSIIVYVITRVIGLRMRQISPRTWAIPRYKHYIQRANFGTKTLSYILLFRNFLFKICASIHHMVHNYQQKRNSDFIFKSCQYFCFKLCYGHNKTRVSRHSDCWINDIKYCRTWIFLHIICLSYTLISRNAG